jgi:hypothetical protein
MLLLDPLFDTAWGESGIGFGALERQEQGDLERERDLEPDRAILILDFFVRWLGVICATQWLPRLTTLTPPLSMETEADQEQKCVGTTQAIEHDQTMSIDTKCVMARTRLMTLLVVLCSFPSLFYGAVKVLVRTWYLVLDFL